MIYLELRTTPREISSSGIDRRTYVEIVLDAIRERLERPSRTPNGTEVHLLLSIDRNMTKEQAAEVLSLAEHFITGSFWHKQCKMSMAGQAAPAVLGLDLCGNPLKGNVEVFTPIFTRARELGLHTVVHFAEVPLSSTEAELTTILSWQPHRLGHAICVPEHIKAKIESAGTALELCLSCNVIAKMVQGSYAEHHLGYWMDATNPIALSTDDVGVFESSLSSEYLLAAQHFELDRQDIIMLSRRAATAAFAGRQRICHAITEFAQACGYRMA